MKNCFDPADRLLRELPSVDFFEVAVAFDCCGGGGTFFYEYPESLRKMTLQELADRTGLTKGYLSKVERSEKAPPYSTLNRIISQTII